MNKNLKIMGALLAIPSISLSASYNYTGYINLNGRHIKGEEAAADATKYDPKNTIFGNIGAMAVGETNEFTLFANDLSADNQGLNLTWRQFNKSLYNFQFNDLNHNLSKNVSSPHSGIGTPNLTWSGASIPAVTAWNPFTYEVKRRNYGVTATNKIGERFYTSLGANRTEYDGIKPMGFLSISGSFANRRVTEIPEAVKFANTVADFEAGYRGTNSAIALKGNFSHSAPEFDTMTVRDTLITASNRTVNYTTSPVSKFYKIGLEGSLYDLPLRSVLSFDVNTTKTWNELLLDTVAPGYNATGTTAPANASTYVFNNSVFEGDIKSINAKVVAKSQLTDDLSTQLYLRYYDRNNDSSAILTQIASGGPYTTDTQENARTEFNKKNAGIVFGYNLPLNTRADLTLDYLDTVRGGRSDNDKSEDYTGQLYLANYYYDRVTPKVQYTYVQTESNFLSAVRRGVNYRLLRRFDVNDKLMQQIDVGSDFSILESYKYGRASFSALFGYKHNSYKHVVLGKTNDNRHIIDTSFSYNLPDVVKVNLYAYIEKLKENSLNNTSLSTTVSTANAATQRVTASEDKVLTYGADVTVPIIEEKLDARVGYNRYKSDGRIDYNTAGTLSAINSNDDYTADSINAAVNYYWKKYLSFSAGYNYENFDYSDIRVNGYRQVVSTTSYYTGAYRDRPYKINEAWAGATYKF